VVGGLLNRQKKSEAKQHHEVVSIEDLKRT